MKHCSYQQLQVGKIYDTLRKRTYERKLYSYPKRSKEHLCGECNPDDIFLLLVLCDDSGLKWTKVLTSKGIVGWIVWIESLDPSPAFVELM